jgi:hypothetical protein
VAPAALSYTYCTATDVETLLSDEGVDLRLDDDGAGTVSPTELARLETQGINYAASRVNFFCMPRYDAVNLASSWLVNEWATIIATRWLCTRRGNPCPKSIQEMYDEAVKDMSWVRAGTFQIPDIAARGIDWPAWSNVTVRPEYTYRKIRVQRPMSEGSAAPYRRNTDWAADVGAHFEI